MLVIRAHDVNDAYYEALWKMKILGVEHTSRNGKVRKIPGPVATVYAHPQKRMLFNIRRDANPFFHIFEGIWMLAGREDAAFLEKFNSNIGQYADADGTFHGAYGHRWRKHFGHDQLKWVINHLWEHPDSRRAVLQMYDPCVDQREGLKDLPCNTAVYFSITPAGALNMTVTNRSNDMIWGCYGANAVHMSMLHEFVARALDRQVGEYCQFSNDLHIYEQHFPLLEDTSYPFKYSEEMVRTHVQLTSRPYWEGDLKQYADWIDDPDGLYDQPFITSVLTPMREAWGAYKMGSRGGALEWCDKIFDEAVRTACIEWLARRAFK